MGEQINGFDHPDTFVRVSNLATLLEKKGDFEQAEPLYRRALEGRRRLLGSEHNSALISVFNLAQLAENRGDPASAQSLYQQALESLFKVSQATKKPHELLQVFTESYMNCLSKLGRSSEQIQQELNEMSANFGLAVVVQI